MQFPRARSPRSGSSTLFGSLAPLTVLVAVACGEQGEPTSAPSPAAPIPTPSADAGAQAAVPAGGSASAPGAVPSNPVNPAPAPNSNAAPPASGAGEASWCKVKAILDAKCVSCHGSPPTSGAPFALRSFADLQAAHPSKPGKKVYERVAFRVHPENAKSEGLGTMPPTRALPADEIAIIDAWALAGAPAGADPTCSSASVPSNPASSTRAVPPTWPPAECDQVYKLLVHGAGKDDPLMIAAGDEPHPQVLVDAPWGTEQVQAIYFKAITDNAKVLHHWILYQTGGGPLAIWTPGDDYPSPMPSDVGMVMPTGPGSMRMDMHYYNRDGKAAEADRSGLEVCVVKKDHFRKNSAAVTMALVKAPVIPANAVNYDVTGTCMVETTQPVTLLTAAPHAHRMAHHMRFTLKRSSGELITMYDEPFQFEEQGSFRMPAPLTVNTGDVITTTCTFTNPTSQVVRFGEDTGNEMCFNFALYYPKGALKCTGGNGAAGLPGGF